MTTGVGAGPRVASRDRRAFSAHGVALAASVAIVVVAALRVGGNDPTSFPVSGDQSSFLYQAVSIVGGDLSFDADDQQRWLDLGWEDQPRGLFVQRNDDGWAFAKPYGYSLLLAPFVAVAGARGVALVGAGLLLAYAWCWYVIGRARWPAPVAALVASAATVGSNAWFMAFPAHADLFVAVLVGMAALGCARILLGDAVLGRTTMPWLCLSSVAAAVLVTEKLPALIALGPVLAMAAWRSPWRSRLVALGAGAVVVGVSIVPYVHYSDSASWSAYGGERYYAPSITPWSGGTDADLVRWNTAESFSFDRLADRVADPPDELASAGLTYAVGRHTGALTFQPVVAALGAAATVAAARRWRGPSRGRDGPPRSSRAVPGAGWAALAGLVGYAAFYLVSFTDNYFGGGQSVGNRYFLQVSAIVALGAAASGVTARAAGVAAMVGAAFALVLLPQHLTRPAEAFYRLERTSAAQRLLPFDGSQESSWRFSCEPDSCRPPPLEPYGAP